VISIGEYLSELGVETTPMLTQRLATALLSAAHGVISLPLRTPTMKWPDIRGNGRLVLGNLIDAWSAKIETARQTEAWPKISISNFL
jgi:hypothetical protein